MPGQRLVGWIKSLASHGTPPVQHHFTGYSYSIQIRSAYPRNFNLPAGSWLHIFHLDEKDPARLAGWHFGDAYRHRIDDGNVSFRARHDCIKSCCVRRRFGNPFPQASSTSPCSFPGAALAVTAAISERDNGGCSALKDSVTTNRATAGRAGPISQSGSGCRGSSLCQSVFLAFAGFRPWTLVRVRSARLVGGRGRRERLHATRQGQNARQ